MNGTKFDALIKKIVTFFLQIIKRDEEKYIEIFAQFVKFAIVGVSNSVVSYVVYTLTLVSMKSGNVLPNVDYLVAQVAQFVLSVLWSFYWNNRFVFELKEGERRNIWKSLVKTYVSYSFTGLFLNSVLLILWTQVLHISEFIAPLINIIISMPINFLINKFWAFKKNNNQRI